MNKLANEYKIVISIILAGWLFFMGALAGEFATRKAISEVITGTQGEVVQSTDNSGSSNLPSGNYIPQSNPTPPGGNVTQPTQQPSQNISGEASTQPTQPQQGTQNPGGASNSPAGENAGLVDGRYTAEAKALKSGVFYIQGTEISDGESLDLKFAANGPNSQVYTEISGVEISMMIIDGDIYMVYGNDYCKLSQQLMSTVGIDLSEYQFDSSFLTSLINYDSEATVDETTIADQTVTRTKYNAGKNGIVLYTKGDEVIQIEKYNLETGECKQVIYVDSIDSVIPQGTLTVDGKNKKAFMTFFMGLIEDTGEDISIG